MNNHKFNWKFLDRVLKIMENKGTPEQEDALKIQLREEIKRLKSIEKRKIQSQKQYTSISPSPSNTYNKFPKHIEAFKNNK